MKLVSIISPVYNSTEFLKEAINSVLNQTFTTWELILVDDGSTDDSLKICREFENSDARIKVFNKVNGGQGSARNLGLQKCTGDYITFLDSDDLYLKTKLEDQVYDLENHDAQFCIGGSFSFTKDGENITLKEVPTFSGRYSSADFFQILYENCPINPNTVIAKKEVFEKAGFFDESPLLRGTEDWDLWIRCVLNVAHIYASPKRNVHYRIHPEGTHLMTVRMLKGKWEVYKKLSSNSSIARLKKKKNYRKIIRPLLTALYKEENYEDLKVYFSQYIKKDRFNFVALHQWFFIKFFPVKWFIGISVNLLYPIGFRIERISYWMFLKK
jgi:glycosyltransferase involved in cell wall biosynthesis